MRIVLIGPPAVGKGTQAKILAARYGIPHISTGDMLRDEQASGSALGRKIADMINGGGFVTDEMMMGMLSARLQQPDCENGFILDGFPRTLPQAEALDVLLRNKDLKLDAAIAFAADNETLFKRMRQRSAGQDGAARADDTEEALLRRIKLYTELTASTFYYYVEQDLLHTVDAAQSIADVDAQVRAILPAPSAPRILEVKPRGNTCD
ncbi:MAG: adenylate kinase [Bdellovibrionales bacterium]